MNTKTDIMIPEDQIVTLLDKYSIKPNDRFRAILKERVVAQLPRQIIAAHKQLMRELRDGDGGSASPVRA
jgi:hypothetical protein